MLKGIFGRLRVIPWYGHAILRVTDQRFSAFIDFGKNMLINDDIFRIIKKLYEIVPNILKEGWKAKNS